MKANTITKQSLQLNVLTENQCEQIIETSFRVLERTGCDIYHPEARKLFKDAGCQVDGIRVRIPTYLLQKAMTTVPKQVIIYDREGNPALRLAARNGNSYFVTGTENQYRIDLETNEKRLTVKQDVVETGLVVDALPNIDVACGLACIHDCTPQMSDVYELKLLLENTTKPILVWNFNEESLRTQVELCAAVAGGLDQFLAKPFIIAGGAPTPPLSHSEDTLGKMLYMFELGLPSPYIATCIMGGTSPMTVAGTLVESFCEIFTGLLLSQLKNEGCPFLAGCLPAMLDMSDMSFTTTSPEFTLACMAGADICKYLNIPFAVNLGNTDAPVFDEQAAFELGTQIYSGIMTGANLNFFAGFLETAMSSSLLALAYCDEAIDFCRRIVEGLEVNVETMAEDIINNVGPSGNFLGEEHTLRHFRESWTPKQFSRISYENWNVAGKKSYQDRTREKIREIIAAGPRKPLSASVIAEMEAILAKAEKSYQ